MFIGDGGSPRCVDGRPLVAKAIREGEAEGFPALPSPKYGGWLSWPCGWRGARCSVFSEGGATDVLATGRTTFRRRGIHARGQSFSGPDHANDSGVRGRRNILDIVPFMKGLSRILSVLCLGVLGSSSRASSLRDFRSRWRTPASFRRVSCHLLEHFGAL